MNENAAAEAFITETLAALAGGRIKAAPAPKSTAYPLVSFHFLGGRDRGVVGGGRRIFSRPLYAVQAVSEDDPAAADLLASQLDALLSGAVGNVTVDGQEYRVRCAGREQPLRREEGAAPRYFHFGGTYRFFIHAA